MNEIDLVDFLLGANLAWHMHKLDKEGAIDRRTVIINYMRRNNKKFDKSAKKMARSMMKMPLWNQLKAFDHWYWAVFAESPCDEAIKPHDNFFKSVEDGLKRRSLIQ